MKAAEEGRPNLGKENVTGHGGSLDGPGDEYSN